MCSRFILFAGLVLHFLSQLSYSQTIKIESQDVEHFWTAYDSVHATDSKEKQLAFIQNYYIDKASEGLKAFLRNKENANEQWLKLMSSSILSSSLRTKTLKAKDFAKELEQNIIRLKTLYPELKESSTYFIIGFNQQGGLIRNNLSIIGTEVVCSQTDDMEKEVPRMALHEYVHTQQTKPDFSKINVLTSCIREGACDFISEIVLGYSLELPYIRYGSQNEIAIWKVFHQDMMSNFNDYWVSTGYNPVLPEKDLGYFIGYAICKSYYANAVDKKKAIRDIIELDYSNNQSIVDFLKKSRYEEYITQKGFTGNEKLNIEGYKLKGDEVDFELTTSHLVLRDESGNYSVYDPKIHGAILTVALVGDFNKWNKEQDLKFELSKKKRSRFGLKIKKEQLGKNGEKIKFKFLINGKYWVAPGFATSNRIMDDNGNVSLYIQL